MKDYCLQLAAEQTNYNAKLNAMREYLQANILRILHDQGFFRTTAFLGGTALRFLYGLPRFSEDLDFSLVSSANYGVAPRLKPSHLSHDPAKLPPPEAEGASQGSSAEKFLAKSAEAKHGKYLAKADEFIPLMVKIKNELLNAGYSVEAKYNDQKVVFNGFFRFKELMFEARLSPLKSQNFSVKLEIDSNPPAGGITETRMVNKFFPITFLTFDLPSLFAGKIHALLTRKYTKGRDFFDLSWYLSRQKDLEPNLTLLRNALMQTNYKGQMPDKHNWRQVLIQRLQKIDWKSLTDEVKNFLENPKDLEALNKEHLLILLNRENDAKTNTKIR